MVEKSAQESIEAILATLQKDRYAAPVAEALTLAGRYPEAIADFAVAVIQRHPPGGTFLDAALGFMPQEDWASLVQHAMDVLKRTDQTPSEGNDAAESILAYASLQNPDVIHPHLETVFSVRPNGSSYYWAYPWRGTGSQHFEDLKHSFENNESVDVKRAAWEAMIQSRYMLAVDYACLHAGQVVPHEMGWSEDEWVNASLHLIGLHHASDGYVRLCNQNLYHLVFPGGYFPEDAAPAWLVEEHPTWRLQSDGPTAAFGGSSQSTCLRCHNALHRLIKFDVIPDEIFISGLSGLELAVCLSCLGWEEEQMFCRHDETGAAEHAFFEGAVGTPEFPAEPLKEATVALAQSPRRWYWQDWALSNGRENLHRMGGEPCWVQDANYPDCPSCAQKMEFLMQLDSNLPTADGGEWLWGSGGIGYVFWCDACKVSGYHWQCT